MPTPLLITVHGLIGTIAVTTVVFFAGYPDLARLISHLGTAVFFFGLLGYVVFIDSRRRWPNSNALQRLGRVFTLDRS